MYVNASLIHELRMMVRHVMDAKQTESLFGGRKKQIVVALQCSPCMEISRNPKPAVTVVNGHAVCQSHWNTNPRRQTH